MSNIKPEMSEHIKAAVPVIRQLVEIYREADREGHEDTKIWSHYALHWAVRRLEAFMPKVRISKEAAVIARKKGIGDISGFKWADQVSQKKMKDPKRKYFHYEHIVPVAQLRRELLSLNPVTDEAILDFISKVDMAWISKEEARKLGAHGKQTDRISHEEKIKDKIEFI